MKADARSLIGDYLSSGETDIDAFLEGQGVDGTELGQLTLDALEQLSPLLNLTPRRLPAPIEPLNLNRLNTAARESSEYLDSLSAFRRDGVLALNSIPPETVNRTSTGVFVQTTNGESKPVELSTSKQEENSSFNPQDIRLRNAGFSLSTGAGLVKSTSSDDAIAMSLIARWNLGQRKATAKWNSLILKKGKDFGIVPYYGQPVFWDKDSQKVIPAAPKDRYLGYNRPELTTWGPFIGSTAAGEKIEMGGEQVRPYLVGLSFGFGFYDQAASFLYFDIGRTVSPNKGFEDSDYYFGISLDGVVLGNILGHLRNTPVTQ